MEFLLARPEQPADSSELQRLLREETIERRLVAQVERCHDKAERLAMLVQLYRYLCDMHAGKPDPQQLEYYTSPEALLRDRYHKTLHYFYVRIHNSYSDRLQMVGSVDRFVVGGRIQPMLPDLCRQLVEQPLDSPLVVAFSHDIDPAPPDNMHELLAYAHERRGHAVFALEKAQELQQAAGAFQQSRYAMHCEQLVAFF
ncbi:hypothetical protein F4X86_02075 [Candidatus Saccharibacteria bacterium]|nr:hypothetical protein [Candidatus Saccharibacteria bacterium]